MDDAQEQDQYEERLKDVFNSFDTSGCGSLCPEELFDLCQSLHLDDATPVLLHTLLQNQEHLTARVDFDQFKNALIVVLSSTIEPPQEEQETLQKPESPEIQPKFVKGSKRYGRRSTPELIEPISALSGVTDANPAAAEHPEDNYDSAVPRKRERWNAHESSPEEYEADGQMHLWNPDEPSTPRGSIVPLSSCLEERLREACEELAIPWDTCADHTDLLALCEHLGLEIKEDVILSLTGDDVMNVQEFVSRVVNHNKPPTPSASTPYRQLKRLHSTQPFDEGGRRFATPSVLSSTFGTRLFSTLDDGTGFTPVEYILDAWLEEGIENSTEILQALNFDLDGKLSLGDLTMALENELLVTKNGIHQAALASFKAEIRHLLQRVEGELGEKEKIRSDLEKAEKMKTQLATEVDERHSAIEHTNNLKLRKLEQDHREKLSAVRSALMKELDQIQQQAGLQREELEAEIQKIREDESFLRDHLSISVKENRRLETELLDSTEKLLDAQNQIAKLQTSLDKMMKDKFGDVDPGSADFLLQEERIKQLRGGYEAQCRELQDRIDELQSELQEFHSLGRLHQTHHKPLSEELESKSPGMESDPGIGSEDVQPFRMSLEAEMMLEQLKDQHLQEMEELRIQLESKINEFDQMIEGQRATHEEQKAFLALRHQQEVQASRDEMSRAQIQTRELQSRLEQAELERRCLDQTQAQERDELQNLQEEEVANLQRQLLEAHTRSADLEEQLTSLEELRKHHATEMEKLQAKHEKLSEARVEEERNALQELERRLLDAFEKEKERLRQSREVELKDRLEEVKLKYEEEQGEMVQRLTEQWERERAQLDEQHNQSLQLLLEEEMLRLVREQEVKAGELREQWESERALLREEFRQREGKVREERQSERLQLEEDYEGMLEDRLNEERERLETEKEEAEERMEKTMAEERERLEESHREAVKELSAKHKEERDALSGTLDKLREDIARERREMEFSFSHRITEVEERFSGDQESVARRFQADISKLERHYQSELRALSQSHVEQKLRWEAQIHKALQKAEEQRGMMEEAMEQERESLSEEWARERGQLEGNHRSELDDVVVGNRRLQEELDDFVSLAQTKEIELSRQLNELHGRLQASLETRDQLIAQSEHRALQAERLLDQTVEDFTQERAEHLHGQSQLQDRYDRMLEMSEGQITERIQLLTERDDLRMKIEELEVLIKQAAVDFESDRQELREHIWVLEEKLEDHFKIDKEEIIAERDLLRRRIKELEEKLGQVSSERNVSNKEKGESSEEVRNSGECCSWSDEEPEGRVSPEIQINDFSILNKSSNQELDVPKVEKDDHENPEENEDMAVGENNEWPENGKSGFDEGCENQIGEPSPHVGCYFSDIGHHEEHQVATSLEVLEVVDASDGENKILFDSCEEDSKPRRVPALDSGTTSCEDEPCHESVVDPSVLEETGDLGDLSLEYAEVDCLFHNSRQQEAEFISDCEHLTAEKNRAHDRLQHPREAGENQTSCLRTPESPTEENVLLHEKISLLQQKTQILENLLAHSGEKVRAGRQILEENYGLKVKMVLLMEHVKELEVRALKMADVQIRYEDCVCENAKLREQNGELEMKVWSLETRSEIFSYEDLQEEPFSLLDEICRMREENVKLTEMFGDLERPEEIPSAMRPVDGGSGSPEDEDLMEDGVQEVSDLEESCQRSEEENTQLRRAVSELQDRSHILHETTNTQRSEACRLAEENLQLRHKMTALKEEDLKEAQEELTLTLEHLEKEKSVAQRAAKTFQKQISELRSQSQLLAHEKEMLSEKNLQNAAEAENLRQQLAELKKEKREALPAEDKTKLAACVSSVEAELTRALQDTAHLEERNLQLSEQLSVIREKAAKSDSVENQLSRLREEKRSVDMEAQGLRSQLAKAQERVKTADVTSQAVNHQSSRLKADVRVLQKERESLKHDVAVLHKRLLNANEKNRVLEMTLHSSGLQHQSKKLYKDEMSRLMEQEQQLLRQENERLQVEVRSVRGDLAHSRDKVRQLDSTVLSMKQKQPSHSSLLKALEQENASLKQQLDAQKEHTKACEAGPGHTELESLQQENESLKAQMARLSTQLLESFQAQLVGLLPPSPHRVPRGQHRGGEEPDNMQDDRERKMKNMEERLREIELSLHNVKLLLKEKVVQLKDQLNKNGKANVLIQGLYVENSELQKALDLKVQRQKMAEKKNYLLEEKISSLNKIVRDLNPSPLPSLPYHYKCS